MAAARLGRLLRPGRDRFRRDEQGASAVEFAFVSMPFFALLGAVIETALGFFASQLLETATGEAARQVYTGQFQAARTGEVVPTGLSSQQQALSKFKEAICDGRITIFTCSDVKVDVLVMPDDQSIAITGPVDPATGTWRSGFGTRYQTPGPSQMVVVQVGVAFPAFFSLLNPTTFTDSSNRSRILQAAVAFRTEPF